MLDPMKILIEACQSDISASDDLRVSDAEEELNEEYYNIEEVEDEPTYTESMIPVFATKNSMYLVESDMLGKYMDCASIYDPKEAIEKIAESNNIDAKDIAVLVESDDYANEIIQEAKATKSKKTINKAVSTSKFLKAFKLKGIKVVKKKTKKSKAKKRKK